MFFYQYTKPVTCLALNVKHESEELSFQKAAATKKCRSI